MKEKSNRFFYGWIIAALSFFSIFVALGTRYCFGVFYVAILDEYGWSRAQTAGAFSLAMLIHASFAPVTGMLIDRFSPRILFPLGATFLALGLAAASRITAVWHLYIFYGVFIAIGINTLSLTPHMALICRWFIRKRGLASGIALAGLGVGTMVLAPTVQFIIDLAGWRLAFLILAAIVVGVLVPMTAIFQRHSPKDVGQYPDGIVPEPSESLSSQPEGLQEDFSSTGRPQQWTFRSALCTKAFWWMALVFFCVSFLVNMLVVHQAAYVVDAGFSPLLAASLVGLVGILGSGGGILMGFLSDRFGRRNGYAIGASAAFAGILFLLLVSNSRSVWLLYAFVILYGLGHGSMGPIPTSTIGDLFFGKALGHILGVLTIAFGVGGAAGPYIAGYFYDRTGSYTIPLLFVLASVCIGGIAIWFGAPHRR